MLCWKNKCIIVIIIIISGKLKSPHINTCVNWFLSHIMFVRFVINSTLFIMSLFGDLYIHIQLVDCPYFVIAHQPKYSHRRLRHLIDYLSDVTELIQIPNTLRKFFGSSDSRSRDAVTSVAELDRTRWRCWLDPKHGGAAAERRVLLRFTRFIVRLIVIWRWLFALREMRKSVI